MIVCTVDRNIHRGVIILVILTLKSTMFETAVTKDASLVSVFSFSLCLCHLMQFRFTKGAVTISALSFSH